LPEFVARQRQWKEHPAGQLFEHRRASLAGTELIRHGLFQARGDKFLSLNRRIVADGAIGKNAIQSAPTTLALFCGLNYDGEKYVKPNPANHSAEARSGVKLLVGARELKRCTS
jgi:hypothetical protein